MKKIIFVENDAQTIRDAAATLKKIGEKREVISVTTVDQLKSTIENRSLMNEVDLAIVDLEMSAGHKKKKPLDKDGKDIVLPLLREYASWVPSILHSVYVRNEPDCFAELTPEGFDAIVPKGFFDEGQISGDQWINLKTAVANNRLSVLLGTDVRSVRRRRASLVEVSYGKAVEKIISDQGSTEILREILTVMNFGSEKITIDKVTPGFSGLAVALAHCEVGGVIKRWLLKFGSNVCALQNEIDSHRRMFLERNIKKLTVFPFLWRSISISGMALIAYEFEELTNTFSDYQRTHGIEQALGKVGELFETFYSETTTSLFIPRNLVQRMRRPDSTFVGEKGSIGEVVRRLNEDREHDLLDESVSILTGVQHGDLHGGNILIGEGGATLIDFANFRDAKDDGAPLMDFVTFLISCWINDKNELSLQDIVSGDYLASDQLLNLASPFFIAKSSASDAELRMYKIACVCLLARCLDSQFLTDTKKAEVRRVLGLPRAKFSI